MSYKASFKTASYSLINFSAYSKLYVTFSYSYLYHYDQYESDTTSLKLIAYNSAGTSISSTTYKTYTATKSATYTQGSTEQTVSVDVSSYNGVGGFLLNLYAYNFSSGTSGTNDTDTLNHTAYIQKIYLA